jgi:predicted transposase YdaD
MLAERYLQRRYREGREEGRQAGRQEGRQEILERLREVAPPDRLEEVDRLIEAE